MIRKLFPEENYQVLALFIVPGVIVIIVTTGLLICDRSETCGRNVWNQLTWEQPKDKIIYCEKDTHGSLLFEEQNSLSNFSFIYFAFVILGLGFHDIFVNFQSVKKINITSHVTTFPLLSLVYSASLAYLGLSSFFYHAYASNLTQVHDRIGIAVHSLTALYFSTLLFLPLNFKLTSLIRFIGLVIIIAGVSKLIKKNFNERLNSDVYQLYFKLLGSLIGLMLFNAIMRKLMKWNPFNKEQLTLGFGTLAIFVFAFLVQEDFIPIVKCKKPKSAFQFHALWHVLCSLGFFILYLFFRADHQPEHDENDTFREQTAVTLSQGELDVEQATHAKSKTEISL